MDTQKLIQYIEKPETLDKKTVDEIQELIKQYPYFQTARLLYIRNLQNIKSSELKEFIKTTAIYTTDRVALFRMLNPEKIETGNNPVIQKVKTTEVDVKKIEPVQEKDESNIESVQQQVVVEENIQLSSKQEEQTNEINEATEKQNENIIDNNIVTPEKGEENQEKILTEAELSEQKLEEKRKKHHDSIVNDIFIPQAEKIAKQTEHEKEIEKEKKIEKPIDEKLIFKEEQKVEKKVIKQDNLAQDIFQKIAALKEEKKKATNLTHQQETEKAKKDLTDKLEKSKMKTALEEKLMEKERRMKEKLEKAEKEKQKKFENTTENTTENIINQTIIAEKLNEIENETIQDITANNTNEQVLVEEKKVIQEAKDDNIQENTVEKNIYIIETNTEKQVGEINEIVAIDNQENTELIEKSEPEVIQANFEEIKEQKTETQTIEKITTEEVTFDIEEVTTENEQNQIIDTNIENIDVEQINETDELFQIETSEEKTDFEPEQISLDIKTEIISEPEVKTEVGKKDDENKETLSAADLVLKRIKERKLKQDDNKIGEEKTDNQNKKTDIIDSFLENIPSWPKGKEPNLKGDISEESIKENDGYLTETLAQVYISQKLYEKAIEVYDKLILKNPEKNTYFAAQIEKVKHLINENKS